VDVNVTGENTDTGQRWVELRCSGIGCEDTLHCQGSLRLSPEDIVRREIEHSGFRPRTWEVRRHHSTGAEVGYCPRCAALLGALLALSATGDWQAYERLAVAFGWHYVVLYEVALPGH